MLGYDVDPHGGRLVVNPAEAERVREIFALSAGCASLAAVQKQVQACGLLTKEWTSRSGKHHGGGGFTSSRLEALLRNVLYRSGLPRRSGLCGRAAGHRGASALGTRAATVQSGYAATSRSSSPGRGAALGSSLLCPMWRTAAEQLQLAAGAALSVLCVPQQEGRSKMPTEAGRGGRSRGLVALATRAVPWPATRPNSPPAFGSAGQLRCAYARWRSRCWTAAASATG